MSYGTCFGCFREAELNSAQYCSACQITRSIKDENRKKERGPSEETTLKDYLFTPLTLVVIFHPISIIFGEAKLFGFFENNFLEGLSTFIIWLSLIGLLKRWSESDGFYFKRRKGFKFAKLILWLINLYCLYLIVDLFIDV
ncbi:hypothetical protein N8333_01525 [Flavobacteriaceae bacterium]|nr:hypothetical protein [Flavobacteriaceae bacterium]